MNGLNFAEARKCNQIYPDTLLFKDLVVDYYNLNKKLK